MENDDEDLFGSSQIRDKTDDVRDIVSEDGSIGDPDIGNEQMDAGESKVAYVTPVYINRGDGLHQVDPRQFLREERLPYEPAYGWVGRTDDGVAVPPHQEELPDLGGFTDERFGNPEDDNARDYGPEPHGRLEGYGGRYERLNRFFKENEVRLDGFGGGDDDGPGFDEEGVVVYGRKRARHRRPEHAVQVELEEEEGELESQQKSYGKRYGEAYRYRGPPAYPVYESGGPRGYLPNFGHDGFGEQERQGFADFDLFDNSGEDDYSPGPPTGHGYPGMPAPNREILTFPTSRSFMVLYD